MHNKILIFFSYQKGWMVFNYKTTCPCYFKYSKYEIFDLIDKKGKQGRTRIQRQFYEKDKSAMTFQKRNNNLQFHYEEKE